ncbi:MAG: carbamoyltransferase [Blastocatellia bacterium]
MLVLGVHGSYKRIDEESRFGFGRHDSAAVLLNDGEVLAAIEEERLDRIKHSNCFPVRSISHCLSCQGLTLGDVDLIATNHEEHANATVYAKNAFLDDAEEHRPPDGRKFFASLFEREFGVDISSKLRFCNHHLAHGWSAYVPSGYDKALVVVLDGDGDKRSGMIFSGEGPKLIKLKEFAMNQSLGNLYTALITLIGYNRFDEYKVMGLAPYGDPSVYSSILEKCYQLLPDGNYSLADRMEWVSHFDRAGLVDRARRKGEPFTQSHMDIAAAIQQMLERIALHVVSHYKKATRHEYLCLAGGVAHNCTMNGKLLYSGMFKNVFVQPAAHDAGGALGAAYAVLSQERSLLRARKAEHLYFGTHVGADSSIEKALRAWGDFLIFEKEDRVAEKTAELLANGNVVGWVQGRSEFGPRALGNRSILADPRPAENKTLINQMVKKRESYRPFAPSVLEDKVQEFFDVPENQLAFPFMIFVVQVREEARSMLQAITHLDGTARLHSVSRGANPIYYELISEFEKRTGVPVLLNTSFNNNVEPIVDTAEDAIVCYLTTGLHYLVIGNYVASKRGVAPDHPAYGGLVVSLPRSRMLVQRQHQAGADRCETVFELQNTVSRFFAPPQIKVSKEMFNILHSADGSRSFSSLLNQAGISDPKEVGKLTRELIDLWARRAVILHPTSCE